MQAMFDQARLPFKRDLEKVPNSRMSLKLGELARDRGRHHALHPRLFEAYWVRGSDLGDEEVLLAEGQAIGLSEDEIEAALRDPVYAERIRRQTAAAIELGAGGVPAWLVDERLLVPGAQPHELFERVLARLGYHAAP
jgi:predicted DsbA family dithiol-disulfide isomerase